MSDEAKVDDGTRQDGPGEAIGDTPIERLRSDVDRYATVVLYTLAAQYAVLPNVRESGSVTVGAINKILRRSTAESLAPMILAKLRADGLVHVEADGEVIFTPALLARWARGAS